MVSIKHNETCITWWFDACIHCEMITAVRLANIPVNFTVTKTRSVQFSRSVVSLWDLMDCSMPDVCGIMVQPWEKARAPHSCTVARKIPWMGEPGRLQSMGSLRVRQDWVTSLSLSTFMHWRRKWQPTPVFLPGESHGWRSLVVCSPWGHTESDATEATWQLVHCVPVAMKQLLSS